MSLLAAAAAQTATAVPVPVGTASAVTARLGLDVRLLNSADVPVDVSLNAVHAPADADGHLLTATVQGAGGGPQTLVDAKVGHSSALVDKDGARAAADLVDADVRVPGLLLRDVVAVHEVKATASCPVHGAPSAEVNVLGDVSVLGKKVSLSASGPTRVAVEGVGVVDVELSRKQVASRTAAATALEVSVTVDPGKLNVVQVSGKVELASVQCALGSSGTTSGGGGTPTGTPTDTYTCTATSTAASTETSPATSTGASTGTTGGATGPATSGATVPAGATTPPADTSTPAPATTHLAETGGASAVPAITGTALVLVGAGTGAVVLTRRRRRIR